MTREFSPNAKECPMKSHLLLTASGPLLILTSVESDLHETDDLRVLDFNGQRVFQLFRFDELGAPILQEQP
jgi:hypothetical protein